MERCQNEGLREDQDAEMGRLLGHLPNARPLPEEVQMGKERFLELQRLARLPRAAATLAVRAALAAACGGRYAQKAAQDEFLRRMHADALGERYSKYLLLIPNGEEWPAVLWLARRIPIHVAQIEGTSSSSSSRTPARTRFP